MKQTAKVIGVTNGRATVEVERRTMCDGCHKNCDGDCAMYRIFGGDRSFRVEAKNAADASVGDTVTVETPDGNVTLGAFICFLCPILVAFGVWFVFSRYQSGPVSTLAAVASFVLYFLGLALFEKLRKKKKEQFVITEIVRSVKSDA